MTFAGRGVRSVVGLLLAILCLALPAAATPKAFGQADTAWHTGALDKAMKLYEDALGEGGLEPNEVVIAHSRIGTVKAALKDNNGALSAFRVAAAIDPDFELPADSGPIAKKLYAKAHKEAEALGGQRLSITVTAPDTIPAQHAFTVQTEIPEGFAVLVARVVVTIEDPVTGKHWRRKQASEPKVTFEFPKRVAMRGARLKVRAAAEDSQNNAWTVSETKIKVEGTRELSALSDEPMGGTPKKDKKNKESFFDGPIPWIIGGALVVGTIVVVGIAVQKPGDVTVGAPAWQ